MEAPDSLRLAVIQPRLGNQPEEAKVEQALELLEQAAAEGAHLALFPEGYPGPLRAQSAYDALPAMAAAARRLGCGVCWSRIERTEDGRHRKVAYLHDIGGEVCLRYERAHPATGDVHQILSGVAVHPGDRLGLAEVDGLTVGVLICSELWIPEVARVLAVRGAEVLLAPAGGGFHAVASNWRLIARSRAIENECHVALTQHLFAEEKGSALIAGPEKTEARLEEEGVAVVEVDLARARWLRATDDSMREPKPFSALPGLLRARRPELYGELSEPRPGLYDYARRREF
jgi:deaminated glutathione amidase